jgi:hypothetical protein
VLLVAMPGHESVETKVFGQECTLRVDADGETLTATRWVHTTNRDEKCRTFVADRANQIERRKLDRAALHQDITDKLDGLEDEYQDIDDKSVGKELADLIALRGKHKAELKVLEGFDEVTVPFERRSQGESVVLGLEKLVQVSFFTHSVMYRKGPLEPEAVQLLDVVESHTTLLSAWQAEQIDGTYVSTIGSGPGSGNGQLNKPLGVAVSGDCVFVGDRDNHRVNVYGRDGSFVRSIGSGPGAGDGELNRPTGVAVAGDHLFVSDCMNDRVCVFSKGNGTFVRAIGYGEGSDEGQLDGVQDLEVSGDHVFVVEHRNHRVSVFGVDGGFVRVIGSEGSGDGELQGPIGVAVADDLVFVTDDNHRVSVFRTNGSFVRVFGSQGSGNGEFEFPRGAAVVGDRVFIVDAGNRRVSVHQLDGTFVRAFGSEGAGNGQFDAPDSIAVAGDRVYVSDRTNQRLEVFS